MAEEINLQITRKQNEQTSEEHFSVPAARAATLLAALYAIKAKQDPSLTFGAGCRSGVCGSCAVLVNGKEQLACAYEPKDGDQIAPLRYHEVLRDLKVDLSASPKTLTHSKSWRHEDNGSVPNHADERRTHLQSDCILCHSCYSACPVLAVNPEFLGPFALTRVFRYTQDSKEADTKPMIDAVQANGVWDCTLCGECTMVCPQSIDPKSDIMMLRNSSAQHGYSDPSFENMDLGAMDFGTPDFGGGGFGFTPQ